MTKYIFDFDDVLFFNTEKFKKHMYDSLEKAGVSEDKAKGYYKEVREQGFTLNNFISKIAEVEGMSTTAEDLVENIMQECANFVNAELVDKVKDLGQEHCYIVTHGVTEYQLEKINRAGLAELFCRIDVVDDTKKVNVESICEEFSDHEVVFVDDKAERFADLDFEKYPNLRKVLYLGPESINEIFSKN